MSPWRDRGPRAPGRDFDAPEGGSLRTAPTVGDGTGISDRTRAKRTPPPPARIRRQHSRGASARRRFRRKPIGRALEWAVVLLVAALLAFVLRTFVFEVFSVPSGSMTPTIQVGDRILVLKAFFAAHDLEPGDIVVFRRPPRDTLGVCAGPEVGDLVKRVVGLPGQTISSRGNTILIDGHPQREPYLAPGTTLGRPIQPPVRIPANHYFVLGDNRSDSCDSRYWGTISGSSIVGRVVAIIWHHGHPDLHTF